VAGTTRPEDIIFSGGWIAADPDAVFDRAIALGHLSQDPTDDRYAGDWMYTSHRTLDGRAGFKHKRTRIYLWVSLDPTAS